MATGTGTGGGTRKRSPSEKVLHRELMKRHRRERRAALLIRLGSICKRCGLSDVRALQIDHIYGGGSKEVRVTNNLHHLYRKMLAMSDVEFFSKYQLLCANCNWIKRTENPKERGSVWPSS